MFTTILYMFGSLAIVMLVFWILYRRYRNFDNKIKAELKERGLELIRTSPTPLFSKSPFPTVEIYDFHYSTSIVGISGEEVFPRIVTFKDKLGKINSLRVHITTRAFKFHSIKWEKELNELK